MTHESEGPKHNSWSETWLPIILGTWLPIILTILLVAGVIAGAIALYIWLEAWGPIALMSLLVAGAIALSIRFEACPPYHSDDFAGCSFDCALYVRDHFGSS
jgi:hypothetical protein